MLFKELQITNFRNFKDVKVDLSDRNIFFGMNDVGKTNFLYALRFLLDPCIRRNGFIKTDFHNNDEDQEIKIQLKLDITDKRNPSVNKITAMAKSAIQSATGEEYFYIRLTTVKDDELGTNIEMMWGNNLNRLEKIPPNGNFYQIDKLFNIIYLSPTIDLDRLFRSGFTKLVERKKEDMDALEQSITELNRQISSLSSITVAQSKIDEEYKKFNIRDFNLLLQTGDLYLDPYKNILPYIKKDRDEKAYPLAGDGQKKLISYSIMRLTSVKNDSYINVFLIEEPENHLHRTTLFGLSKTLFNKAEFPYLFITTHSSELLSEMDDINLTRIFYEDELKTKSAFYQVGDDFKKHKKALNSTLSQALFYDRVLLVEGPSEKVLFDYVLENVCENMQSKGIEVLSVNGIAFDKYINVLKNLGIKVFIKTDNDITKKNLPLGFNRVTSLINSIKEENPYRFNLENINNNTLETRNALYQNNLTILKNIEEQENIYLSKIDLENDLYEVVAEKMNSKFGEDAVAVMQSQKLYNMIELLPVLTKEDCLLIKEHENFKCLGDITQ